MIIFVASSDVECARMWHIFGESACRVSCRELRGAEVAGHPHTKWLVLGLGAWHRAHTGPTWLVTVVCGQLTSPARSLIKLNAWSGGQSTRAASRPQLIFERI
jgi:hypothetical protein